MLVLVGGVFLAFFPVLLFIIVTRRMERAEERYYVHLKRSNPTVLNQLCLFLSLLFVAGYFSLLFTRVCG